MALFHAHIERSLRATLRRMPAVKNGILRLNEWRARRRHTAWDRDPARVRALPRKMTVAITAACDQRCIGCKYGRDFMPGHALPTEIVLQLLEDARDGGVRTVRLYGGEPLLHPDLPVMIARSLELGMSTYITTNGILLGRRIDELYDAGLRGITIGYYGHGEDYDTYVQSKDRFARLEQSLERVRSRYGSKIGIQLNYLIMRPSCRLDALEKAWRFCERFDLKFNTDLIHYSLPYFKEGRENELQFGEGDRGRVQAFVDRLLELKEEFPQRFSESAASLRSIPDWLFLGKEMRIPCDAYKLLWVGADGSVQLCYVTFRLGNLHEMRLRGMLHGERHQAAARGAFCLDCPGCHCERQHRITKHAPSYRRYGRESAPR